MNRLTIIGNLTADPEQRVTNSGKSVCTFSVAVNRMKKDDGTDYFRVSAWNQLGETCAKYLKKGRKVAVVGPVSVHTFMSNSGEVKASMEVMANDVEFLSPRDGATDKDSGFTVANVNDELPWGN